MKFIYVKKGKKSEFMKSGDLVVIKSGHSKKSKVKIIQINRKKSKVQVNIQFKNSKQQEIYKIVHASSIEKIECILQK